MQQVLTSYYLMKVYLSTTNMSNFILTNTHATSSNQLLPDDGVLEYH